MAHKRIKYLVKHLELLAADSAKPAEGTHDPVRRRRGHALNKEQRKPSFLSLEKEVMEELIVPTLRKKAIYSDGEARRSNRSRNEPRGSRKTSGRLLKPGERPQAMVACRTKQKCRGLSKQARRRKSVPTSELFIKGGRAECRRKGRLAISFEK